MEGIYVVLTKVSYFINLESGRILSFDENSLPTSIKPFYSFLLPFPILPVFPFFYICPQRAMSRHGLAFGICL